MVINTALESNKLQISWPLRVLLLLFFLQLTSLISMSTNNIQAVDAIIKAEVSALVDVENLGHVQSVQTTHIGPVTFFTFNFFAQENHEVTAKAIQVLGFSPHISCLSASKSYRC